MELVPYTPPQLYGPFLPQGMDAGNGIDSCKYILAEICLPFIHIEWNMVLILLE